MPRTRTKFYQAALLATLLLLAAGCGQKQPQDTKDSAPNKIGFVNIDKAVKAHSKYAELQKLQREYDLLAAQAQRENNQQAKLPAAPNQAAGLIEASQQEYQARMAAKQTELNAGLNAASEEIRGKLAQELEAYAAEVDKEYQPQIFSLQLKLKTLQLTKEEATALEAELNRLQKERLAKISAREETLSGKMKEQMAAKQAQANQTLEAYAKELDADISRKFAAKPATPPPDLKPGLPGTGAGGPLMQQLAYKRREITGLQDFIIEDIKNKAGKVAVDKGLDLVLAEVQVSVTGVDITDAVVAEIKK